ncbi:MULTISPECIES: hypothetical protein [Chromohalobacter]|uniref:hypothetical protein n=1 Tax=Chromohalobacter TaxID=42054 RepID=UPI001FFD11FA|nr:MULTISPECIES: hypothetical protein [Chromohalobacter]MCK2045618.1 hypothetical protein [Chromohalobacter moromii]MCT8468309.1 hypothetical protein [Chromohalobacter canadensis]MCT8471364.1 hypothetical protein [Chromohalobacter canadensis]MCT8498817.1 hypothetical protein [Chromohalobacter canadensis]
MKAKLICMTVACFSATLLFWIGVLAFSENYAPYVIEKAQAIANLSEGNFSPGEEKLLNKALSSGDVVDVKPFVDSLSKFYTSVINILIFLVSLTTIMVAVYLRQRTDEVSKEAAEHTAKEILSQQSVKIVSDSGLSDKVKNEMLPGMVNVAVEYNIENIQEDIENLKDSVAEIQRGSDDTPDGTAEEKVNL